MMAKYLAPKGTTSISHRGKQHEVGEDRVVDLPHEDQHILKSHGFKLITDETKLSNKKPSKEE